MNFRDFGNFCRKEGLEIFTIQDLKVLFAAYSPSYLRVKIHRWIHDGLLRTLRRGVYMLAEVSPDEFEISANLLHPSYISLESALSHYSIIPDVSAVVTAITSKNTRRFTVGMTDFHYYHIQQSLFFDFFNLRDNIFVASREKALLDFFYFRKPVEKDLFFERLNPVSMKDLDMKKLFVIAKKYPFFIQKSLTLFHNAFSR